MAPTKTLARGAVADLNGYLGMLHCDVASHLPLHLRVVRNLLRRLNYHLTSARQGPFVEPFDGARLKAAEEALAQMPMPEEIQVGPRSGGCPRFGE